MALTPVALLVAAALGGQPECPPSTNVCPYRAVNGFFGDGYWRLRFGATQPNHLYPEERTEVCRIDNWKRNQGCFSNKCPLRLSITSPPEYRMTLCMNDNLFQPFSPDAHLSLTHPFNGVEMDIVAVGSAGDPSARGCNDGDFAGKNFNNTIAIVSRGGCYFYTKFENAQRAGAKAGVMVNNFQTNDLQDQIVTMVGNANALQSFPAAAMPRHYGVDLFEALFAGVRLRGSFVFDCDMPEEDEGNAVAVAVGAACPRPALETVCAEESDDFRLCSACPMEYHIHAPGELQGSPPANATNMTFCLLPNQLLPAKADTFLLLNKNTAPWLAGADDAVLLPANGDVMDPCKMETFEGLRGRLVFFEVSANCLPYEAVMNAEKQGVMGVMLLMPPSFTTTEMAYGISYFVNIPVHSAKPESSTRLVELRGTNWTRPLRFGPNGALTGYILSPGVFYEGRLPPREDDGNSSLRGTLSEIVAAKSIGFEWTPTIISCGVIIILLMFCVVFKFIHGQIYSVDIPVEDEENDEVSGCTVPLAAASMVLSLSLLCIIASTAFVLAYSAGKESMDDAVHSGQEAARQTYENAVANVDNVAQQLRESTMSRVNEGINNVLAGAERIALSSALLYIDLDGTWATFDSKFVTFVNVLRGVGNTDYVVSIWTKTGFFAADEYKTDDRADDQRRDGINGSVAQTNNGFPYLTSMYEYDYTLKQPRYWATSQSFVPSPHEMLGAGKGDPQSMVTGKGAGFLKWMLGTYTFPNLYSIMNRNDVGLSMSVFTPVYNRSAVAMGAVESRVSLTRIGRILDNSINGELAQNLTVVVFDIETRAIIGVTGDAFADTTDDVAFYASIIETSETLQNVATMWDTPSLLLNAFNNVLDANNVTVESEGSNNVILTTTFDQAEYYTQRDAIFFSLSVNQGTGRIADLSPERTRAYMLGGGCGACVSRDAETGRQVMHFDGRNDLIVDLNLTTNQPQVASTRVPTTNGTWRSDHVYYGTVEEYTPGEYCVTFPFSSRCIFRRPVLHRPYSITVRVKPDEHVANATTLTTPWLISTQVVGDAVLRLFANGELQLNTMAYACATQPVAGGMPAGAWTTLTAVVRPEPKWGRDRKCEVWVNGTKWSEGRVTINWSARLGGFGWVVGRYFKGAIDHLILERTAMVEKEIVDFHTQLSALPGTTATRPTVRRHVPSRVYYTDVSINTQQGNLVQRSPLGVATLLPRDDVMRRVDRNNNVTVSNLMVKEANTHARLDQRTREAVFVILVIALVSVLLFLIFNDMITAPFASIAVVLMEAAVMKIDVVPECDSYLTEIGAIRRAMIIMVSNLKQYRSYMPQHLMVDDEDLDPDSEEEGEVVTFARQSIRRRDSRGELQPTASGSGSVPVSPSFEDAGSQASYVDNPLDAHRRISSNRDAASGAGSGTRSPPRAPLQHTGSQATLNISCDRSGSSKSMGRDLDDVPRTQASGSTAHLSNPNMLIRENSGQRPIGRLTAAHLQEKNKDDVVSGEESDCASKASKASRASKHTLGDMRGHMSQDGDRLSYAGSASSSRRGRGDSRRKSVLSPRAAQNTYYAKRTAKIAQGQGKELLSVSLTSKRVSFCVINIVGFHEKLETTVTFQQFIQIHALIVSKVCQSVHGTRGMTESFSGDRFLASFNATKTNLLHEEAVCNCSNKIHDHFSATEALSGMRLSIGLASGEAKVGNMGNEFMKRFCFLTPVLGWACAVERIARKQLVPVVVDYTIYRGALGRHYFLFFDQVNYPKVYHMPIIIAQLREPAGGVCADEWMYEMEKKESRNPYHDWNTFFECIVDKRWDEAQEASAGAVALAKVDSLAAARYPDLRRILEQNAEHYPSIDLPFA